MTTRMITCCPACSTLFKVAPDQLQIAGGWVRCGQCMAVFDARARMLPAEPYTPSDLDSDWQEEVEAPSAPQPDLGERAVDSEPPVEADRGDGGAVADDAGAMGPAPQARPESPATEEPAFAGSTFELAPPAAPEKPVAVPVFIGKAQPDKTSLPKAPAATGQTPEKTTEPTPPTPSAPVSSLPIPTRDELDRRYARLLETLARLRENAERQQSELGGEDTQPPDDDDSDQGSGPIAPNVEQGGPDSPQRDTAKRSSDRAASADRQPASRNGHGHGSRPGPKRPSATRGKDRRAERAAHASHDQDFDEDLASRPMIDFVLSEIGYSLPSVVTPPRSGRDQSQPEPRPQTRPAEPELPSFVERARRRAFWALPQVRAGLWLAAGILAITLAAQIAISQRDRLAAQHPGMAPLLQALCRPLRCQIAPWRHLGAVTIDGSAFVRRGPEGFGFAVTLRNSGAAPVATPSLELALIDAQDQPLARRVLNPADWGAPPQLAAYGEFSGAALLTVLDMANPQAVSNYRLTAFYP